MNIQYSKITVSGLRIDIIRKDIKNLHLGVYPPNGKVRVAAPRRVSDEAVRLAVVDKLRWIKRKRAEFHGQDRQSRREMVSGESHYYQGRRFRLRVEEDAGPAQVVIRGKTILLLQVRPGTSTDKREKILNDWYRRQIKQMIPPLLEKWEKKLNVKASFWGVRKMKTKWGSCNPDARRIWLNLELAKKPVQCLEYILLHELAHLIERHHNDHYIDIMDKYLPKWRHRRDELNSAPLAHETWVY